jgi:hypothetical protein
MSPSVLSMYNVYIYAVLYMLYLYADCYLSFVPHTISCRASPAVLLVVSTCVHVLFFGVVYSRYVPHLCCAKCPVYFSLVVKYIL